MFDLVSIYSALKFEQIISYCLFCGIKPKDFFFLGKLNRSSWLGQYFSVKKNFSIYSNAIFYYCKASCIGVMHLLLEQSFRIRNEVLILKA